MIKNKIERPKIRIIPEPNWIIKIPKFNMLGIKTKNLKYKNK